MSATPFSELSTRQQNGALLEIATTALQDFQVDVARVKLIDSGFNATFRVDAADSTKYALRLNMNSPRTLENVRAEVSWTEALADHGSITVARPQRTRDDDLVTVVGSHFFETPRPAVLYSWLGGRDVSEDPTYEKYFAAGVAMAHLHQQTQGWSLPRGAGLPTFNTVLWTSKDRLDTNNLPLPAADVAFLRETLERAGEVIQRLWRAQSGQLIHADLHGGNMKWYRGRLSVLDFDDCGIGLPVQDLAVATYYLRDQADSEAAMRAGYASVRPLPVGSPEDFEWLVAHRNVLLLSEVAGWVTAKFQAVLPTYAANTVRRLKNFLETGRYSHNVPA